MLKLQGLLDGSSRVRNTLCVLCTLGLGAWMALQHTITIGTCYSFFVFGCVLQCVPGAICGGCAAATAALQHPGQSAQDLLLNANTSSRPAVPPSLCRSFSFAFALANLTNMVGDVAKAAGAVNRAMQTMQTALGVDGGSAGPAAAGECAGSSGSSGSEAPALAAGAGASTSGRPEVAAAPTAHGFQSALPIEAWHGEIEFRGVQFSHPGGWTLRDVSFAIPAGQRVALVGPSGGGELRRLQAGCLSCSPLAASCCWPAHAAGFPLIPLIPAAPPPLCTPQARPRLRPC